MLLHKMTLFENVTDSVWTDLISSESTVWFVALIVFVSCFACLLRNFICKFKLYSPVGKQVVSIRSDLAATSPINFPIHQYIALKKYRK